MSAHAAGAHAAGVHAAGDAPLGFRPAGSCGDRVQVPIAKFVVPSGHVGAACPRIHAWLTLAYTLAY